MTEWNLRSRSHHCCQCAKDFTVGEACYSSVVGFSSEIVQTLFAEKLAAQAAEGKAVKNPEYVRLDFCETCWKTRIGVDWVSQWKRPYVAPEVTVTEPLPRETAESLLRKLMEGDHALENVAVIFVLAVILERKKILLERQVRRQDDGSLIRLYEHRKSGEIFLITDPQLQMDQIPSVQARVEALLAGPSASSVTLT